MSEVFEPKIVAFVCNWCTYTGADLAGTSRLPYAANVRVVRLPCSGRISPHFIVKALEQGADGVLVSGCHPGDCHYTSGNYHARRKFTVLHELLGFIGVEPDRVRFAWVSAAEGKKWADLVDEVTTRIRRLGRRPAWGELQPVRSGAIYGPGSGAMNGPTTNRVGTGARTPSVVPLQPATNSFARQTLELRARAREWLREGTVKVVVGYGEGSLPGLVRPVFVTAPEEADRLVWNPHCRQNLSVYLTRPWVTALGPVALVVKGCDERSVVGLMQENHPGAKEVHLIGMACHGVDAGGELAGKCAACDSRKPSLAECVIGEAAPAPAATDPRLAEIARLEAMTHAERWNFWQAHFERCLKCYACRAACPLCSCDRCIADKAQPRWIPSGADGAGNLSWHLARAQHLAGRCIDCGACSDACPANIPLYLLNRKLSAVVEERFGYVPGHDPQAAPPLTTFRDDDPQEFIH